MGDGSGTGVYGALITNKSTSEVSRESMGKKSCIIIKRGRRWHFNVNKKENKKGGMQGSTMK